MDIQHPKNREDSRKQTRAAAIREFGSVVAP